MKVSLFVTCLSDLFYPKVGQSIVQLLEEQNVEVDFPQAETCCGQIAFNSGYWKDTKKSAKHFLKVFEDKEYIITPSGSCAHMIRHYYPILFEDEPLLKEKAVKIAKHVYEFTEFFVNILGVTEMGATFPEKATYHTSCHMCRGLNVKDEPFTLLKNVEDLELVPLSNSEDCCGFGGTFAIKHADISTSMAAEKLKHIKNTGADVLIGSDLGCLMHLKGCANRSDIELETMHIAEVLANGGKK